MMNLPDAIGNLARIFRRSDTRQAAKGLGPTDNTSSAANVSTFGGNDVEPRVYSSMSSASTFGPIALVSTAYTSPVPPGDLKEYALPEENTKPKPNLEDPIVERLTRKLRP